MTLMLRQPPRTIGLLGGAGPAAAARMHERLITRAAESGAVHDEDYPGVIVINRALPRFTALGFAEEDRDAVALAVTEAVSTLVAVGADIVVSACNTIDPLVAQACADVAAEHVSLVTATARAAEAAGFATVGVVCSDATRRMGLFEDALADVGVAAITAKDREQTLVDDAVAAAMGGHQDGASFARLILVCDRMIRRGAEAIIIGCTEASLFADRLALHAEVLDSLEVAVAVSVDLSGVALVGV